MNRFLFLFLFMFLQSTFCLAEKQNPFGSGEPTDPSDFAEDESDDMGFTPDNEPPRKAPPPRPRGNLKPQVNQGRPPVPPSPPSPRSTEKTQAGETKSTTAKLADYLELDPSVRGLEVKNFDIPDQEIKDIVTLMSKWTGKNFIIDQKVRGKITIIGPSQVTLQEAYQAFLTALEANGLTTVQSGKFIRIIETAEARRSPVKTYAGEYAPQDDQFITRIFQLKFINADEVQREFRDLTTRQGKLFAYEPTNSIIITDTGSNIQRIKEILESLDVKSYETTLHVLRIKNTSAKTISDMLGEIYGDPKGGAGGTRTFKKSALERTRGGGLITKIIPDEATNSLVVLANAAGFEQLKTLVAKLDVRVTDTGKIHVYYCEYAKAEDLATTLASLAGGTATSKKTKSTTSSPISGGIAQSAAPSSPTAAELEGGVKVTSDPPTNALVITANSSDYNALRRVIKKLDIPRLQVFIETAIIEVTVDRNNEWKVNYGVASPGHLFGGGFVSDRDFVQGFLTNSSIPEGVTAPLFAGKTYSVPGPGGTTVSVPTFVSLINLLARTTNASVLSTPQIIALDNSEASFKVQDSIPVATSLPGSTSSTSGVNPGTIDRLKVGIDIKMKPFINAASKTIRLEIEQTVDSEKPSASVPQSLQNIQRATTSRVTNTSAVVKDRDFVMLGGLMADKVSESITKVPLLGDIPILGWLFKSRNATTVKTNLIILLHPQIIGTTLESANLIKNSFEKRKQFIDKHVGGNDSYEDEVNELKEKVADQERRARTDIMKEYRRNDHEDDDMKKLIDKSPREEQKTEEVPPLEASEPEKESSTVGAIKEKEESQLPLIPQEGDTTKEVETTQEDPFAIPNPEGAPKTIP